jgi:hypothetical protein
MRYYTTKPKGALTTRRYLHECNHPLYSQCTLVRRDELGLAIVQKRYNRKLKIFWIHLLMRVSIPLKNENNKSCKKPEHP